MIGTAARELEVLEDKVPEAARLLRLPADERHLPVLRHLAGEGEMTAGTLAATVGLSRPALSRHLALLREDGLVPAKTATDGVLPPCRSAGGAPAPGAAGVLLPDRPPA